MDRRNLKPFKDAEWWTVLHGPLYGFAERIEILGDDMLAYFDVVQQDSIAQLTEMSVLQSIQAIRVLPSILLELKLSRNRLQEEMGTRFLVKGRWYRLEGDEKGELPGRGFLHFGFGSESDATFDEPIRLNYPKWLDRRTSEVRWLENTFSLNGYPDATEEAIEDALNLTPPSSIICFNVGQGSCAAACDSKGKPLVYFDFGGGYGANVHTYPSHLPLYVDGQPVILSHWDMDHWVSADLHPDVTQGTWIVPRQGSLGVKATKLALEIHKNGKLLVWPSGSERVRTSIGTIFKLKPHLNRNYSGLVVFAEAKCNQVDDVVLIPGDAPYHKIPSNYRSITAIIATHHGGWYRDDHVPLTAGNGLVAYSYGTSNTYGHPKSTAVSRHHSSGWHNRKDTPQGAVYVTGCSSPSPSAICSAARSLMATQP